MKKLLLLPLILLCTVKLLANDNNLNFTKENNNQSQKKEFTSEIYKEMGSPSELIISDEYSHIAERALAQSKTLTSVKLANSITSIGDMAFLSCDSLTSVELSDSTISIGKYAFAACKNLNSITIPRSVDSIKGGAFNSCEKLTNIKFENSNFNYTDGMILSGDGKSLISTISSDTDSILIVPQSVTRICDYAFFHCKFTSIKLPDNLEYIGRQAFILCYNLKSISIPKNVTYIGNGVFNLCYNLDDVKFESNNYIYTDGMILSNDGKNLISTVNNNLKLSTIIPEGIINICQEAFYGCTRVISIKIPKSVTSIGDSAFESCVLLYSINIPSSVIKIGDSILGECKDLKYIKIAKKSPVLEQFKNEYKDKVKTYKETR